jgi:hypothetical protein
VRKLRVEAADRKHKNLGVYPILTAITAPPLLE